METEESTGAPEEQVDENFVISSPSRSKRGKSAKASEPSAVAVEEASAEDRPAENQSASDESAGGISAESASSGKKRKKEKRTFKERLGAAGKKKVIAVCVVVAVIVVVAGVGFWKWHETPSFCGAICHSPMDPYMPTYYSEPGEEGVDKWGNTVEDSSSMLSATHREYADMFCMDCHVPAMQEQVTEGIEWITGNYYYPLYERDLSRLVYYRGVNETEFCLNSSCHNMTKEDLTEATSDSVRNPHSWHHTEYDCSDCHKAHRASVMVCSQCHEDYTLPDGWITVEESKELETIYGQYEDFEGEDAE